MSISSADHRDSSDKDWDEIPFQPPADFAFEPELREDPPRELPEEFRKGWFAHERQTMVRFLLVFGALSIGTGLLPVMELWTEILPPLKLLLWGGAAALTAGIVMHVHAGNGTSRRYNYVRLGLPIVARVRSVQFGPQYGHGAQAAHRYTVEFDYIDPELAQLELEEWKADRAAAAAEPRADGEHAADEDDDAPPVNPGLLSDDAVSDPIHVALKNMVSCTYRAGDYVTAVHFPGKLNKSIRLYGMLGLRSDLGVVIGVPIKQYGWWPIVLGFTGLFLFPLAMGWNVYAWRRYWPVEHPAGAFTWPLALGAIVFGGLQTCRWIVAAVHAKLRPSQDELFDETATIPRPGPAGYVFSIAFSAALGSITMLCWFVTFNAKYDESKPTEHPVTLSNNPVQTDSLTYQFLYRDCTIKGQYVADQQPFTLLVPPSRRAALQGDGQIANRGVVETREGNLGWRWLDQIRFEPPPRR